MKKISFMISVLGIFILLLAFALPPKIISSPSELSSLIPNQKIIIQGRVVKETYSENYKTLALDNEIQLKCDISCPNYLNKKVSALTILEPYNNKNYLRVLKIKLLG